MRHTLLVLLSALVGASIYWMIQINFSRTRQRKTLQSHTIESSPPPEEASPVHLPHDLSDAQLEQMAELHLRMEALLMSVETLEVRQRELADLQNQAPSSTSIPLKDESPSESSLNSERDGREQWEHFRLAVHANVDESESDPNQAALASEEIVRRLANESDDHFSLQDVYCGTTICRIRLRVARDPNALSGTEAILPDFLPWEGEALIEEDERDPSQLIIHLAREGETLTAVNTSNSPRG